MKNTIAKLRDELEEAREECYPAWMIKDILQQAEPLRSCPSFVVNAGGYEEAFEGFRKYVTKLGKKPVEVSLSTDRF